MHLEKTLYILLNENLFKMTLCQSDIDNKTKSKKRKIRKRVKPMKKKDFPLIVELPGSEFQ